MASSDDAQRLVSLLQQLRLPTTIPQGLDASVLLDFMRLDKKNLGGRLRLILWRGAGQAVIADAVAETDVLAVLTGD